MKLKSEFITKTSKVQLFEIDANNFFARLCLYCEQLNEMVMVEKRMGEKNMVLCAWYVMQYKALCHDNNEVVEAEKAREIHIRAIVAMAESL